MIGITSLTISVSLILYNLYNFRTLQALYEKLMNLQELQIGFQEKLKTIEKLELKILHLQEQIKIQNEFVVIE
jgi:hypothetical protein